MGDPAGTGPRADGRDPRGPAALPDRVPGPVRGAGPGGAAQFPGGAVVRKIHRAGKGPGHDAGVPGPEPLSRQPRAHRPAPQHAARPRPRAPGGAEDGWPQAQADPGGAAVLPPALGEDLRAGDGPGARPAGKSRPGPGSRPDRRDGAGRTGDLALRVAAQVWPAAAGGTVAHPDQGAARDASPAAQPVGGGMAHPEQRA